MEERRCDRVKRLEERVEKLERRVMALTNILRLMGCAMWFFTMTGDDVTRFGMIGIDTPKPPASIEEEEDGEEGGDIREDIDG